GYFCGDRPLDSGAKGCPEAAAVVDALEHHRPVMQELGSQAGDVSRGTFALIGLGAIGTTVAEEVARLPGMPVLKGALVRRKSAAAGIPVFTELDRLLAQRPE